MSAPRFHVPLRFAAGETLELPRDVARHAQVLRLQPGDAVVLFDGRDDREWRCRVASMARDAVSVEVGEAVAADREIAVAVTIAVGMPANERMDALVEKATELGAARIVPLMCARSVLRLDGSRAEARRQRWQAIASSASEQCGRARVPAVELPARFASGLASLAAGEARGRGWLLSLDADAMPIEAAAARLGGNGDGDGDGDGGGLVVLSGPEGGLAPEEEAAARAAGFAPVGLGPRVLRADTAPLAVLAVLSALLRS